MPPQGAVIYAGVGIPLRFTVLDVDERKVNRVQIELLSPRSPDQETDADHLGQMLPED
jgi:hypothetical protein